MTTPPAPERVLDLRQDTPEARAGAKLGRATALACAVAELRSMAAPFRDLELTQKLGWCEGRLLEHLVAARKDLDRLGEAKAG